MKVWVVVYAMDYDGSFVEGVFSSYPKAKVYVDKKTPSGYEWKSKERKRIIKGDSEYDVWEYEVL